MVVGVSGQTATVDLGGATREVLVAMEEISPGQLVVVHAGIAIGSISREDVIANVELYRDIRVRELLETGMDKGTAEKVAGDEMGKLLRSLGIR
jgi:hydrogenase maturation factor